MDEDLTICEYSTDSLIESIADGSPIGPAADRKQHLSYFTKYFERLEAKTILIEKGYIDRDFLEDFSAYYVRCFAQYEKVCKRLHFFDIKFSKETFEEYLEGSCGSGLAYEDLKKSYIGFVVVKPLPKTYIGRTCLKTYPKEAHRDFPPTRPYKVNLFGIELTIESLAFQEQDSVVAACATSALWSASHSTGKRFHHVIPSPVEITRSATDKLPGETRVFPNEAGLTSAMMAKTIRDVGLEPYLALHIRAAQNNPEYEQWVKRTVYAYLSGGIPVILGIALVRCHGGQHHHVGDHAVTIAGFSVGEAPGLVQDDAKTFFTASRMEKLYVHDDQVGPFSRMRFDGVEIPGRTIGLNGMNLYSLDTSWGKNDAGSEAYRAIPRSLLIPLYHKIRIPYKEVHQKVDLLNSFLKEALNMNLEWEVHLTTNNDFKAHARKAPVANNEVRRSVLLTRMPKFLWKAVAKHEGDLVTASIFDATGIEQDKTFVCTLRYDHLLSKMICEMIGELSREYHL